jgi:hypothetical protein
MVKSPQEEAHCVFMYEKKVQNGSFVNIREAVSIDTTVHKWVQQFLETNCSEK